MKEWAIKNLTERVALFKRRYPNSHCTIQKLRKLYKEKKIKLKKMKIEADIALEREKMQAELEMRREELALESQLRAAKAITDAEISTNLPRV